MRNETTRINTTSTNSTNLNRRNASARNYYVDGNTVRRAEAAPDYTQSERLRRERRERIEREQDEERRRRARAARRNQEKALRMSRRYVMFLTMAVLTFGCVAGFYINIQSDITARMKTISSLESRIADLKAENDEAYKRINTAIDLDSIKNTAMTEYGMSYARESQIIYYSVGEDDYMHQYREIP